MVVVVVEDEERGREGERGDKEGPAPGSARELCPYMSGCLTAGWAS